MLAELLLELSLAVGAGNFVAVPLDLEPPAAAAPMAAASTAPAAPSEAKPCETCSAKPEAKAEEPPAGGYFLRLLKVYDEEFKIHKKDDPNDPPAPTPEPPARRGLPAPYPAFSWPVLEYQGPIIGIPQEPVQGPFQKALDGTDLGQWLKDNRIAAYGWATVSGNFSTNKNSNSPTSYFVVPNRAELDQLVFRQERLLDTVQTDHVDWGFRLTSLYGIDYRYTTAGGNFSQQLLKNNRLYGYDPLEYYLDFYIPWVAEGLTIRAGRYISPPDIEAQLAPDNYLASHSILFTYDDYTHTGILATLRLSAQWQVQAGIYAGGDMAPWYNESLPTGEVGVKWTSADNKDSVYLVDNSINNARYRESPDGGHDNFNYVVGTWSHTFTDKFHTATEAYYMWQENAHLGGTPSNGPPQAFGGGGGVGPVIPGTSKAYGVLNYTVYALGANDYVTFRNEWWRDAQGMRSGYAADYSSHTIGLSHNFNAYLQVRPEVGYYRSYEIPTFDLGTRKNMLMFAFDTTLRF